MKRASKAFEIALSGVACAVAAGALTLGSYVGVLLIACILVAEIAIMAPLSKDHLWGAALCYLGALLLSFLFTGFYFINLIPFAVFFGLQPIANYLQKRFARNKIVFWAAEAGKAVWFDLAMWLSFRFVFVPVFGLTETFWYPFVEKYFFLVLFLGGTVFFAVYDYLIFYCQRAVNSLVRRIRR